MDRELLDEQISYYRARASEYDEWFLRLGRYDRGEAHRRAWFAEVAEVEAGLRDAQPQGRVLELACGTGLWTRRLVEFAEEVTAIDASPEVLRINQERVASGRVRYVEADLFGWYPSEAFDFVFFGFWLSHVPPDYFESFWSMLRAALRPGGSVFFVDNANNAQIAAKDHRLPEADSFVGHILVIWACDRSRDHALTRMLPLDPLPPSRPQRYTAPGRPKEGGSP